MDIEKQFKTLVDGIKNSVLEQVKEDLDRAITDAINEKSKHFDDAAIAAFGQVIKENLREINFPERSIPVTALDTVTRKISGDGISGGIIENFGSTGIDDRATDCQVTVLDEATVFENNLVAKDLTIKGLATFEGDVIIRGVIPVDSPVFQSLVSHSSTAVKKDLDYTLFSEYSKIVLDDIHRDGLDLNKIKLSGKEIMRDGQLTPAISDSSLQTVGTLRQLQVSGETQLSGSLYTTKKRVGVNTMDPSAALTVWDEEIELQIGKRAKDTAWINTPRAQRVIIGSDNHENIICDADGSTQINTLKIGNQTFVSESNAPNYEGQKGSVVFNSNPSLGGPMGWVCLGGAKWANFGIID